MGMTTDQAASVLRRLGLADDNPRVREVAGGDTSQAFLIRAGGSSVFIKCEAPARSGLLSAEADGLGALARTGTVRVPAVLGHAGFEVGQGSWLALEALDLQPRSRSVDQRLGTQLAALHRHRGEAFGWHCDNYLGPAPQSNTSVSSWSEFFHRHRLAPQIERLRRACRQRNLEDLTQALLDSWMTLSADHHPEPSLLHGDLWAGNASALPDGTPVIYDPAVHYGDRECDLAMANLFGGYAADFFDAYQRAWPLPDGWQQRRDFYQLYHLLNHANLFGGGYLASVENRMRALIGRT
ncbi:fructosamine kinase family protein [Wenzhouxiangella limi]|uniref:Fructosamine kinase family protein n=1 Tax=Wenzhouxiangella limi TaxID=2707351 RepID=A0A845V1M5_9GAMM|nr:fructosamine kinase family protein [Wenzhouxiangella limi]NDY95166.1 fructosamine kinase family protein [Wenzhouxiangella limi]